MATSSTGRDQQATGEPLVGLTLREVQQRIDAGRVNVNMELKT